MAFRKIDANVDAPIIEKDDEFPLILFSHGLAGNKNSSAFLNIQWATFGYIVASIDHEEPIYIPFKDLKNFVELRRPILAKRAEMVSKTLDVMLDNKTLPELIGVQNIKINEKKVIVSGHSFGSATAFTAAAKDSRINGGILLLDPWLNPCDESLLKKTTELPLMVIRSDHFNRV